MKISRIKLLKSIDRLVGPFLIRTIPVIVKKKDPFTTPPNKINILFIRPGGIGDAVHLIPAIRILKKAIPQSKIDILAEKRNWEIFKMCSHISNIYLYDRVSELIKSIRGDYHIVIDTEQWHRLSAVVAYLTGAPLRVGFGTNERGKVFTNPVSYSHDDYEVYSFFNLIKEVLKGLNLVIPEGYFDFNHDVPFLEIKDKEVGPWVTDFVSQFSLKYPQGYCVISPGATVRERRWGGDRYADVAQELLKKGFGVVVVGTSAERFDSEVIVNKAKGSVDLTGRTSLMELAYILSRARLFIGPDSGVLHIAVGLGVPTVSLFGAGIAKKWAPRGEKHVVINKNLPCSPCTRFGYTPECRYGVRCLSEITCEKVSFSAFNLLNAA